jgi:hypothetical protein
MSQTVMQSHIEEIVEEPADTSPPVPENEEVIPEPDIPAMPPLPPPPTRDELLVMLEQERTCSQQLYRDLIDEHYRQVPQQSRSP